MSEIEKPTKTDATKERYFHLAEQLALRYLDDSGLEWGEDPMSFCEWFFRLARDSEWSKSTWRQYRAALTFFMEERGPKECQDYLNNLEKPVFTTKSGTHIYGAGRKQKSLPEADLKKIIEALNPAYKWDSLIALWLMAARHTGLRPGEWRDAELIDGKTLRIKNAKNSNGRANGDFRRLDLTEVPDSDMRVIEAMLKKLDEYNYDFDYIYERCRTRLKHVTKLVWPKRIKRPTLYSPRHQFRADAAAHGYDLDEIAAMMGHATDYTASRHYGLKSLGESRGGMARPYRDEVSTIRPVSATNRLTSSQRQQSGGDRPAE